METLLKYSAGAVVFGSVYWLVILDKVTAQELLNMAYVLLGAIGIQRIGATK